MFEQDIVDFLASSTSARPRRKDEGQPPAIVIQTELVPLSGELLRILSEINGFGVAVLKDTHGLFEGWIVDYQTNSSATLFAHNTKIALFPGYRAEPEFFLTLFLALKKQLELIGISDSQPQSRIPDESFFSC